MYFTCAVCGAELDPEADAGQLGTHFDGHHYHIGCERDTCQTCGQTVRCAGCHAPYIAADTLDPTTHDGVPFDYNWYNAWVTQAAQNANQTHWVWSEHVGATTAVADQFWQILRANNCLTIPGEGAHYYARFNSQYLGGREDLYFA